MTQKFDNQDGRISGRRLQSRRLKKWVEAEGLCAMCRRLTNYADPRQDPQGFHLDHIIPLFKGGEDTDEQTQVLCVPCHEDKTNRDLGQRVTHQIGSDGWPV